MNSFLNSRSKSRRPSRTWAEQLTFTCSLLIVGCLVSLVLLSWLFQSDRPAVLNVSQNGEIRAIGGQFYIPFVLMNEGGENVQNVQVRGILKLSEDQEESGELSIDFLSAGEREEGALIFEHPPQEGQFRLRVASYQVP